MVALPFLIDRKGFRTPLSRFLLYTLSFAPAYTLLSVSREIFFLLNFTCLLVLWIQVEESWSPNNKGVSKVGSRKMESGDAIRGLIFLVLGHAVSDGDYEPLNFR